DLGAVLHAVLEGVQQEEASRIAIGLALIREIDHLLVVQTGRDRDELVAARGCDLADRGETRPWIDRTILALVLPAFGPQDEGQLRSDEVREQLADRARSGIRAEVQLQFAESATGVDEPQVRPPVVANEFGQRRVLHQLAATSATSPRTR